MLACVFGTPSPLTYWALYTVRVIFQNWLPDYVYIHTVKIEQLREEWLKLRQESKGNILFFSDCPDGPVSDLFRNLNIPKIVVQDDLEDIVIFNMKTREMQVEISLRFATQAISSLNDLVQAPEKLFISSEYYRRPIHDFVADICGFLGIGPTDVSFSKVVTDLIGIQNLKPDSLTGEFVIGSNAAARWPGHYELESERDRALLKKVADPYSALKPGVPLRTAVWPPEVFSDWDRPGQFVKGPIRLVGGVRFIVCGPYLHLPRGRWKAQIFFEVGGNKSGNKLYSDILAGGELITGIITALPKNGTFEYEMEFDVVDPILPLEVRFEIREGAIEGVFNLGSVKLERMA